MYVLFRFSEVDEPWLEDGIGITTVMTAPATTATLMDTTLLETEAEEESEEPTEAGITMLGMKQTQILNET